MLVVPDDEGDGHTGVPASSGPGLGLAVIAQRAHGVVVDHRSRGRYHEPPGALL